MFTLSEPKQVTIAIKPPGGTVFDFDIGGLMLEDVTDAAVEVTDPPKAFVNTTQKLTRTLPVCEDTAGDMFRTKRWSRRCVRLCGDGFSRDCTTTAQTHCYWETEFGLSQWALEAGYILNQSGFARGNFNYRIDSVGLNFVGVGTRDCSSSPLPSTCHGAAFLPYSLEHRGPYIVRNHKGEDVEVKLFTGAIEHARGLASERYLTNPLSGSDSTLMDSYFRGELRGRPLDGTYVLRVWEEPGVSFGAVQDVQVALKYRYWTRFN